MDWDFSPTDYTCFEDRSLYRPRSDVSPTYKRDHIPANYVVRFVFQFRKMKDLNQYFLGTT